MHAGINENRLNSVLRVLFPTTNIVRRARKKTTIISPVSKRYLEVDFWVSQFNIAFEFLEAYHFTPSWYSCSLDDVQFNDDVKQEALKHQGRTLIKVPFWWDGTAESLAATIARTRPDLEDSLSHVLLKKENESKERSSLPSLSPPFIDSKDSSSSSLSLPLLDCKASYPSSVVLPIPDCPPSCPPSDARVELMHAPFLKPASVHFMFSESAASGWWISEKYDGIRVCWIHSSHNLYSHSGRRLIALPGCYQNSLSSIQIDIDGEIWFGRGMYDETQRTKYGNYIFPNNCYMRFLLYDCPSFATKNLAYEERCDILFNSVGITYFAEIISQMRLTNKLHQLEKVLFENILAQQGGGLMFKLSRSPYTSGHDSLSSLQLKVKRTLMGTVVEMKSSEEDEKNTIYVLEMKSGTQLFVTLTSTNGFHQINTGDNIDIAINSYGPIINADLLAINNDDKKLYSRDTMLSILNGPSQVGCTTLLHYLQQQETVDASKVARYKQYGYWTEEEGKNMKSFFDEFAAKYSLGDPTNPTTWYFANTRMLKNEATFVRHHYGGSISSALIDAYPDIGLNIDFLNSGNYWKDKTNRKELFDRVASSAGFDPLGQGHGWYRIHRDHVLAIPGGAEVLDLYGGSLVMGLCDIYPSLALDESTFTDTRNYWHRNTRKYATT